MPSPADASGATPSSAITFSEGMSQLKLGVSVLLGVPLTEITSPAPMASSWSLTSTLKTTSTARQVTSQASKWTTGITSGPLPSP